MGFHHDMNTVIVMQMKGIGWIGGGARGGGGPGGGPGGGGGGGAEGVGEARESV